MAKDKYPEHSKMKLVQPQSQAIHDFIDWLNHEKKMFLAEDIVNEETRRTTTETHPIRQKLTNLVAEYYEIDLKKIEKEKDAMVDELRESNKTKRV